MDEPIDHLTPPGQAPIFINSGQSERGSHRIMTHAFCLRKGALLYPSEGDQARHTDPPTSKALIKGILLHSFIAHYYAGIWESQQGQEPSHAYQRISYAWRMAIDSLEAEGVPRAMIDEHSGEVWDVCELYMEHYVSEPYAIPTFGDQGAAVEVELRAQLTDETTGQSYLYTQRVDAIFQDRSGYFYLVDHKSTSMDPHRAVTSYELNLQMLGYQMFGKALFGSKFGGVMLNMIRWPRFSKSKKTPGKLLHPAQFARHHLTMATGLVPHGVKGMILEIEHRIEGIQGLDPMAVPPTGIAHGCQGKYDRCKFWETCRAWSG